MISVIVATVALAAAPAPAPAPQDADALCTRLRALPLALSLEALDARAFDRARFDALKACSASGGAGPAWAGRVELSVMRRQGVVAWVSARAVIVDATWSVVLGEVKESREAPHGTAIGQPDVDALIETVVGKIADDVEARLKDKPRQDAAQASACAKLGAQPVALLLTGNALRTPLWSALSERLKRRCVAFVEAPATAADDVAVARELGAAHVMRISVDVTQRGDGAKADERRALLPFEMKLSARTLAVADRHIVSDVGESESCLGINLDNAVKMSVAGAGLERSVSTGHNPLVYRVADRLADELAKDLAAKDMK